MTIIIRSRPEIETGIAALRALDSRLAAIHDLVGEPPLRLYPAGLEGLAWIIVSQQVSVASARAIWARTKAVFDPLTPERLIAAPDEDFRAGGLSMPKIRTLRAVARALAEGFDLDGLAELDADKAHAELVKLKGIGPWTADVYLMFCLGHADAFAAGDLALQEAAKMLLVLEERPNALELAAIAQAWRPWRAVAARLLFAYYANRKNRPGAPVQDGAENDAA
ncbi:DNA-3-methyladenine glycosidase [Labrys miyagiensis]|uniref:DNA-3-methyladenine glycosylase II n=1 Tax=Labrys miyagiensis TaxID=346912 RepID=A0ABQ6CBB1_9HYPH|nr:DNA-3-methyladenine glycosylase [Labrys miyagiensis]GLS17672.1 DNA-3-methyladenine glycosidase [Labrys miyagiensis]